MQNEKQLVMRFDPNTIEHLGVKMYSQIPRAIAELIANSYDADAKNVTISLFDDGDNKKIIVEDDGVGMTFDEVNDEFLIIGRNRREEGKTQSPSGTRTATGKKGLGKLALFGIGDTIEVITKKKGQKVHFMMNWGRLKHTTGTDYTPEIISIDTSDEPSGTKIILSDLKRKSPFDEKALAVSLSKLFNFFDKTFKVIVIYGDSKTQVDSELKYFDLKKQFEFNFPEYTASKEIDYQHKDDIAGKILTTETPLRPGLRGITLYANGRLVNAPEFFGRSESSHFYSYITGWLEVDFVDNWEEDVISTNRQSLNWDMDKTETLRDFLQSILSEIQKDWRQMRKEEKRKKVTEKIHIDVSEWYDKLPEDIQHNIESIVDSIDRSELTAEEEGNTVKKLYALIPEYPYYHWRNLHKEIKGASYNYYKNQDYYGAFFESAKKYIIATKRKSEIGHDTTDSDLMAKAFHHNSGSLSVTENYKKSNGEEFSPTTLNNIQEGHFHFSKGVVQGGRHTVAHEEINDLRESGLFSEKDCLDLLSLLSHLHNRLDNAEKK